VHERDGRAAAEPIRELLEATAEQRVAADRGAEDVRDGLLDFKPTAKGLGGTSELSWDQASATGV